MTDRSLIIIDELGRSTSMEEGTAIAMEICDTLARSKAFTFVTTHFIMLTKLAELFINIKVWQLETIPIGNTHNPKALKLNFKFSLVPGVTTVRGYGIYMVRGIWPDDVMKHVDQLQESYFKKPNNPNFPSIDKRVRLRYELDCKLNKLKLRKRFTLAQLNTLINEYNSQMQNLGSAEDYAYSQNIINQFQDVSNDGLVVLEHSIFDASQSQLNSLASQENSEIHHEQVNLNNQGMYPRMSGLFTQDISSQSINIDNNNFFNLPLNNAPQIIFNYDSSQSSGNVTQRVLSQERRKELPGYISNFNDDLSELSASALSQKLEEILRQEEMDKLNFQVPAPPPRPSVPSESPFISTFSRALEDDSRKTSTPMISTIQHDAKGFGDSSNLSSISKRYAGDVTHIRTDRLSFSFPRHQEDDIDIESVVEDLESFAEEIENNDENDKDAAINNDDLSQLSSNEISQRYEAILRQEEMDKRIFQVPPPPQIEIQVSESSFNDLSQLSSNDISQQYKAILRQEEMDKRIFQVPPPPQREIQVLESFDDLSQLSSNAISQQYEAILRQEEMEKRISQGPPPPQREIQIPESSFNSSFSLPLEENSKKTSTPTLGRLHLQQVLTSFGNSSGNRNSGDISILRNQKDDDIDIASMVEDLEPFIEEIENNNENEDEGDTINNDDVSQLSCSLLSQRYKAIEWQEETDKRIFQAPPPPQQDIQVPESPFTSTFSRPLQEDSRKTSTPTLGRLQQDFGNSFGNRNSGDVTHVTTKRSFSIMRNQKDDDIDIASMVEDLESFIEEIENNNEHDNEDAIDNYNILKPSPSASSSGALSQKFEDIMRQDEMDEHFSQRVPQVPESPFTSTFSRPLQEGSRRTSTPICDRIIQPGAKNFGNSSTISKGSDRMSFSLTRYQEENADIVSKAGDFETIVDEIDINDEKGPGREPRVESPVTSTSSRPRYFGNSSNLSTISKKFTGNVTSDKICFSLPRHPENDMVEDMESLIYIENKNQNAVTKWVGWSCVCTSLPISFSQVAQKYCY